MGKRGPAPKKINWEAFDKLVSFDCTQDELAAFFECDVKTLDAALVRDRGIKLSDITAKKKDLANLRIRRRQFEIMESDHPAAGTMAIFLGKVRLNQNDKPMLDPTPPAAAVTSETVAQPKSFEDFCETAGYPRPYPKQVEMMQFCIGLDDPRLLLGARNYGKTDYITILGVAYWIYLKWFFKEYWSTLILSKSKTRNAAIITEIAHALKANGVTLEKENSTCLRVQGHIGKDHSVEVLTIKSSFRGRHPKQIIMDDPVTEEDVSEAMRLTVKSKYDEAYKLCKNIAILGQPSHAHDLYADLRPILKKLEVPHGTIPELDADLDAMRLAGVDSRSIEMSYHLRIPQAGAAIFANLKFLDRFPNGDSVAFIDPSDGGDYTAVAIVKAHLDGVAVQGRAWKLPWYHCLDEMVAEFKLRGVRKIRFETNSTGTQPVGQLRELLAPLGIGVSGAHSDSNKHACIVSAGFYSHLIHLSKESDRVYTDLVVRYEKGSKFDDPPDSLARCLEWLGLIRGKKK